MRETWKDAKGFEGFYQISDFGRVRSLPRLVPMVDGRTYTVAGKILVGRKAGVYQQVCFCKDGETHTYPLVHRLVLETFVGLCPEGMECRHMNGKRDDNRLENLCWGTRLENNHDKHRHGTMVTGERNHFTKTNWKTVLKIRRLRERGWTTYKLAAEFGLDRSTICQIVNRKTWKGEPVL